MRRAAALLRAASVLLAALPGACTRAPDAPAGGAPPAVARSITVRGEGRFLSPPTRADFDALVVVRSPGPELAWAEAGERMLAVMRQLEGAGLRPSDLQVQGGSLEREADGYRLEQRLRITVRDLNRMAPLLAAALGGGADALDALVYSLDDPRAAGDRARERALLDARQRAESLAAELEAVLGEVLSVVEDSAPGPARAGEPGFAPAVLETAVTLQVTFRLRD